MKFRILASLAGFFSLVLISTPLSAQQTNFGFDELDASTRLPKGIRSIGREYTISADSVIRHGGKYSIRVEPSADANKADFGSWIFVLPAVYEGSTVELRGYLRLADVTDGYAGLLVRIDGELGMLQFDDMKKQGLKGTADWKQYSVKLPLPKEAKSLYLGMIFQGKGTVWVDDLEFLVDGKSYAEAKTRPLNIYKADQDKEFESGSRITSIQETPTTIGNLVTLARVWGFLKYYHPAIAAGDYQWDYELLRVMPGVILAKSRKSRNDILSKWIDKLGPIRAEDPQQYPDSDRVKMYPDLTWTNNVAELGAGLVARLDRVKNAQRTLENYYIGLTPGVGNPIFKNEKPYASMSYPDAGFRLLGLFRYWNMIQYYFPYKYLIGEDWNGVLRGFLPKFIDAKNELEYKLVLLELIGRVHDTHANIWQPDKTLNAFKGARFAPLTLRFVENKAVVVDFMDNDLGKQTTLKKGDVILGVNGRPVEEIVKAKLPYTPASNYPTQLRLIATDLLRSNDSSVTVRYEREGQSNEVTIGCYSPERLYPAVSQKRDTCGKFVANDVGYIYPGTIKNSYIPVMMMAFANTKGIVIDMRCYPSEFIVFSLSRYLMSEQKPFVQFTVGDIRSPGLFAYGPRLSAGGGGSETYKGKVVVLVNETTISQAEYTTMAFRAAPNVVVLGSTTSAADGNVSQIVLPGGVSTMISGIGVYYPDGRETQRVGIVPDIELKPTIKGIRENKDELLEKAIELIHAGQ